jgi:hypothetical protein
VRKREGKHICSIPKNEIAVTISTQAKESDPRTSLLENN